MSAIAAGFAPTMAGQGAATSEIARNVQQAAQGTRVVTGKHPRRQAWRGETGSAAARVVAAAQELPRHFRGPRPRGRQLPVWRQSRVTALLLRMI
jgi:hypothetical protein